MDRDLFDEGILIIFLGILGVHRVLDSYPDAGPMITYMLHTLLFIFLAIILIGLKVVRDAIK